MRKGTTPTFEFELPFDISIIENAKIVFSFNKEVRLEKYLADCEQDGNTLRLKLTQEETFLFECNSTVNIQVRVLTIGGDALASDIFNMFTCQCLDGEVLT